MKTVFVTGNDTNVGKTWVTRGLVRNLVSLGEKVQVVKPVETGVTEVHDAVFATEGGKVEGYTLMSYEAPLAPVAAARKVGEALKIEKVVERVRSLPECGYRVIEGAGGIGVPFDVDGRDGRDLAKLLEVDYVLMVIENRLGAMNQARLMEEYVKGMGIECGFWLNECERQDAGVLESNREFIYNLSVKVVGDQGYGVESLAVGKFF